MKATITVEGEALNEGGEEDPTRDALRHECCRGRPQARLESCAARCETSTEPEPFEGFALSVLERRKN